MTLSPAPDAALAADAAAADAAAVVEAARRYTVFEWGTQQV